MAATDPRPVAPTRSHWRETLPIAAGLLALFCIPWGPVGALGLRWAWDVVATEYAAAIPVVLGPTAGLLILWGARFASPRARDLTWTALGLLLLSAGLAEATELYGGRGLGPGLLVAAALCATSHRLRLFEALPRVRRVLPLVALALAAAHLLSNVPDGKDTVLRVELLWRFASGAQAIPQGFLAHEAMLLYYPIAILGSATAALWPRPPGALDKFLHFIHAWGLPLAQLVAALPLFMYMPPTHGTGFLASAIAIMASMQLTVRALSRCLARAGAGEYAQPEAHPFFARLVLSSTAGAMIFLSFPRFDQLHLAWLAMVPALFVIGDASTPRRALFWGWYTGIVANLGAFYWMTGLLEQFAGFPVIAALPVVLLLAAHNGFVYALWGWLVRRFAARVRPPLAVFATVAFVAVELCWWEIFPWFFGNSQHLFLPVIQVADLAGVSGVSFVVLLTGFTLHVMLRSLVRGEPFPKRAALAAGVVLLVTLGYGVVRIHQYDEAAASATKLKIGVAQSNIGIKEPRASFLRKTDEQDAMARALAAKGADLVVLPESALPFSFPRPPPKLPRLAADFGGPTIFGAASFDKDGRQFNTAYLLERDGTVAGAYDKNYPLPFGEYLPFMDRPWMQWLRKALPYASFLTPGTEVEVFEFRGHRLGIMICYEDILPRFTRRLAGKRPNVLINITNDAWFGRTTEPHHHMALSIMRAVENRLFLVRSVRTGISGFVDATGRIYAQTQLERPETLLREVAVLSGATVYRSIGDVFGYGVVALLLLALADALARARRERRAAGISPGA